MHSFVEWQKSICERISNGALQILATTSCFTKVHVEGEQEEYLTVTVTMNYIYSDTLLSSLLDAISKHCQYGYQWHERERRRAAWSKVGVVDPVQQPAELHRPCRIRVKNPDHK